ncbi:MAG: GPW/gp25 family protein [Beijerinckiaceae bacterium]|nr:GPW/gp25 family protein [Beijerinckiaceae bacterium]
MTGVNRTNGRPLDGFGHVLQSIDVIFSTSIGERVMRRHFGSSAPILLGRLMTANIVLRFFHLVAVALEIWEPRFKIARVTAVNSGPDQLRLGRFAFVIEGEYRPRGHLGDPTPEGRLRRLSVAAGDARFTVSETSS